MPSGKGSHTISTQGMRDLGAIKQRVLGTGDPQGPMGGGAHPYGERRYWVKLTSNLSAGSPSVPTTCTVNVWLPDPADTSDSPPLIVATDTDLLGFTVVNYDQSLTGLVADDLLGKIEYMGGVWSIYWLGCPV